MQRSFFTIFISTLTSIFQIDASIAQRKEAVLDPAGFVTKYNTSFAGIGPKVYVLPAPRTKEEMLRDTFAEILSFQDSIQQAIIYQRLVSDFKSTNNEGLVKTIVNPLPQDELTWNTVIERNIQQENYGIAYGLLNEYANQSLSIEQINRAISLLESALQHANKQQNIHDRGIIQSNLSSLLIYSKKFIEAGNYEEAYYQQAVKDKSIVEQAESLVKIAKIQAQDKDFKSAENTIIRKAIPLFNRSKHYEGKILAWQELASIYQMQNKHTEAQWFLIQARDLAETKKFPNELAEIEYMLASSKFIQKNYSVAKKELDRANNLARKENNKLLQLAIVEKLGRINMIQHNTDDAAENLEHYWALRAELFLR
ncbi:tetratricopeptide repeat protein [Sphingobacterium pedocola]|uniref:Tetratricopeptide repeat-containing protein n=1 Tax=Sphingobacterium pedocola TaxID=2082722 RepID=A0ABR9TBZ6_9SPHI|nr:tetratricopeptide repeat protein [Sphingobacterium pedocola]MBE8722880.1 tetratricopeptide repeat-containing protein [Sphingobacterium pedocola]